MVAGTSNSMKFDAFDAGVSSHRDGFTPVYTEGARV